MLCRALPRHRVNFTLGLCLGFVLCHLMSDFTLKPVPAHTGQSPAPRLLRPADVQAERGALPLSRQGMGREPADNKVKVAKFDDLHVHRDDDTEARLLSQHVRELVMVMTTPHNLATRAVHVQNTWGRRARTLLFMSSERNASFPTVGLNVTESRMHLTSKTMQAFRYAFLHHYEDADWFMKTDDDTYVILENLRYMLAAYDPRDPIYFGHKFNTTKIPQGYASGGAGYVMSKEALRRLVTVGQKDRALCAEDGDLEDFQLGVCLLRLGVRLVSSLDDLGRTRFHCAYPTLFIRGHFPQWMRLLDPNTDKHGIESISDLPISFHYISANHMYEIEFYVYHIRPYGISLGSNATSVLKRLTHSQR
ncbi:hypothetical protein ACOMHN_005357 [Nucella lapillus]